MKMFNSRETEFRNPTGAVPSEPKIHFRLALPPALHCSNALLAVTDDTSGDTTFYSMYWSGMVGYDHEQWECDLSADRIGLFWYHFRLETCRGRQFIMKGYGGEGHLSTNEGEPRFQLLCYDKDFETPSWLPGGIMYQIFPDRFYFSGEKKKYLGEILSLSRPFVEIFVTLSPQTVRNTVESILLILIKQTNDDTISETDSRCTGNRDLPRDKEKPGGEWHGGRYPKYQRHEGEGGARVPKRHRPLP